MCETGYCDLIVLTPFDQNFQKNVTDPEQDLCCELSRITIRFHFNRHSATLISQSLVMLSSLTSIIPPVPQMGSPMGDGGHWRVAAKALTSVKSATSPRFPRLDCRAFPSHREAIADDSRDYATPMPQQLPSLNTSRDTTWQ
jgi:hypothetical protein